MTPEDLTYLARHGAKVPTMSRRLSSIGYAHRFASLPNPVDSPRVHIVWEGIRRERAQPVDQAPALMPPVLWDVLAALPDDLSGVRDRALLLVGFVGAFRRSELASLERPHVAPHPRGLVITIPTSKTDPYAKGQLVVLPHSSRPERCPVASLLAWLEEARIPDEPEHLEDHERRPPVFVFRPVHRNGATVAKRGMSVAAVNNAVQRACLRALVPRGQLLLGAFLAGRLRHLRLPAGRLGPGHRPSDPAPVAGVAGPVHPDGERLDRQRGDSAGPLRRPGRQKAAHRIGVF